MIPTAPRPAGTSGLPSRAQFWMPRVSDLDDEGFGFFRDTWLIRNVPARDAREVIDEEAAVVSAIDGVARDAEHFERLASAIECGSVDDLEDELSDEERVLLDQWVPDAAVEFGGLELGAVGLVHALATVRILPAASCRSHADDHSWSDVPVVYFASTEFRARALQPLVVATGCALDVDASRPELLLVHASSILEMMALASAVMRNRRSFVQPRSRRAAQPGPAPQ